MDHADWTSRNKGILQLGRSDVATCIYVSSMPAIHWTIALLWEQVVWTVLSTSNRTEKVWIMLVY